jgi:hypothetical protein
VGSQTFVALIFDQPSQPIPFGMSYFFHGGDENYEN